MTGREIAVTQSHDDDLIPLDRGNFGIRSAASVEQTFVASLEEHWRLAKMLVASGLLPNAIRQPEQAMAIMLKGHELNLPPMQSFSSIHIIDGKPSLAASLMMALCVRDAGCVFETLRKDAEGCEVEIRRPGWKPYVGRFLKEDAERVKIKTRNGTLRLTEKDNWKNYPTSMYFSRAASDACRTVCPDILAGMYTPEELEVDIEPTVEQTPQVDTTINEIRGAVEAVRSGITQKTEEAVEVEESPSPEPEPQVEDKAVPAEPEQELKEGIGPVVTDIKMPDGYCLVTSSPGWFLVVDIESNTPITDKKFHKADGQAFAYKHVQRLAFEELDAGDRRRAIGTLIEEVGWPIKIVGDFAQTLFSQNETLVDQDGRVALGSLGPNELLEIWDAVTDAIKLHNLGEDIPLINRETLVAEPLKGVEQDDLGI